MTESHLLKLLNIDTSKEAEEVSDEIMIDLAFCAGAVLLITLLFAFKMPWYFKIARQMFLNVC